MQRLCYDPIFLQMKPTITSVTLRECTGWLLVLVFAGVHQLQPIGRLTHEVLVMSEHVVPEVGRSSPILHLHLADLAQTLCLCQAHFFMSILNPKWCLAPPQHGRFQSQRQTNGTAPIWSHVSSLLAKMPEFIYATVGGVKVYQGTLL